MSENLDYSFEISRVICAMLKGCATEEQNEIFRSWADSRAGRYDMYEKLLNDRFIAREYRDYENIDWEKAFDEALKRKYRKTKRIRMIRNGAAAIACIFAMTAAAWLIMVGDSVPEHKITENVLENPLLVMPDGSQIILDRTTEKLKIASQENINIIQVEQSLIYEPHDGNGVGMREPARYGVLKIPEGMTFHLVLEDKTEVWLNAGSQLHYPASFADHERRVRLEGEAYFEVSRDSLKPFIVEYAGQELTVLGTRFDIYAYPGEKETVTTLAEGCVHIALPGNETRIYLTSGQQAIFDLGSITFSLREVNPEETSLWKEGIFPLDGLTLEQAFRRLARWYKFDYVICEDVKNITVNGNLPVYEDAATVFRIIEHTGLEIADKSGVVHVSMRSH